MNSKRMACYTESDHGLKLRKTVKQKLARNCKKHMLTLWLLLLLFGVLKKRK